MLFLFILIGLAANRFDWRQQTLVVLAAVALAVVQFSFPRFL
jgi:hypothetical protein